MIKRDVQTGPNSQDGGIHTGLLIVKYQLWTAGVVKREPKTPAEREIAKESNNRQKPFIFIYQVYPQTNTYQA